MYGCIIDIDARSVTLDHEYRQIRRSYGGLKRMEVTGNAFDRIQDIATAHGFRKFRGSFFVHESATYEDVVALFDDIIEKCPWFPRAATQAYAFEITGRENLIDYIRGYLK